MRFLGLAEPESMPSDARIDYVYRSTYIATAFMMKVVLLYPGLMDEETFLDSELEFSVATVKQTLKSCMLRCTGRGFDGADVLRLKKCVKIFCDADADIFLQEYLDLCPAFTVLYHQSKVLGIDQSQRMIEEVKRRNTARSMEYRICGIQDFDYPEDTCDLVSSNLVLHFIENLEAVCCHVRRTLKPGGIWPVTNGSSGDLTGALFGPIPSPCCAAPCPSGPCLCAPLDFGGVGVKGRIKAMLNHRKPGFRVISLKQTAAAVLWTWDAKAVYEDEETGLLKTLLSGEAFNWYGCSTFATPDGRR